MWDQYRIFVIRQGHKVRRIEAPTDELKSRQRSFVSFYNEYASFFPGCTARAGYSVLDNAAPHQGARILFKTDIRSFYPTVTLAHLLRGFDLDGRAEWIKEARSKVLECLIPVGGQLTLPTGAPTSPVLCNIAASILDYRLADISSRLGYCYTRYIDDLTFSSKDPKPNYSLEKQVLRAMREQDFESNKRKTQWVVDNGDRRFMVTGIALKDDTRKTGVLKEIRRICRARLDKIALNNIPLDKVTQGYMAYVRMIDQSAYQKLNDYLEKRKARYVLHPQ